MKVEGISSSQPVLPVRQAARETGSDLEKSPAGGKKQVDPEEFSDPRAVKDPKAAKDPKAIKDALDLINKTMENYNTEVRFTLHKGSGEFVVRIINTEDHSVIREIPPERVLDMVAHLKKMLGIIVDKFI